MSENLLAFQLGYPLLIRGDDGAIAGVNDAIKQRFDLLLDLSDVRLQDFRRLTGLCKTHVPGILEHGLDDLEQIRRRLKALENALERRFKFVPLDRLTIAFAALRRAEVIGIFLGLALRPAGRQRLAAVVAQDESAQREIGIDVLARGSLGFAFEPLLYLLECFVANESFVLALAQPDAPIRRFDISGIDDARQQIMDALITNLVVWQVLREGRLTLKETLDLNLRFEAPGGEAFQRLLQDGGIGFVAHQQPAVTAHALIAIANRSLKHPIAVLRPRAHPVDRLLAVLLALMLRDRSEQVLDQLGIRVLAELDGRADQDATRVADLHPQFEVRHQAAREAANVVDDDRMQLLPLCLEEGQHGLHAGPRGEAAGRVITEDLDDFISLVLRELAAASFLRGKPIAAHRLLGARHAAIDDRLCDLLIVMIMCIHDLSNRLSGRSLYRLGFPLIP